MTTIATDGKTIAADTRMIGQYIESGHAEKMIQTLGGGGVKTTLTGAGAYAKVRKFFDWYRNGQDAESYPEEAVEIAMKLDPNTGGNIIVFEV